MEGGSPILTGASPPLLRLCTIKPSTLGYSRLQSQRITKLEAALLFRDAAGGRGIKNVVGNGGLARLVC